MYSRRDFLKVFSGNTAAALVFGVRALTSSARREFHQQWRQYEPTASSAQAWLETQKRQGSQSEWRLLQRAQSTLEGNILWSSDAKFKHVFGAAPGSSRPEPWAPLRGICPSPSGYRGIWNWDSAFHAIAVARWDAALARDQIKIVLERQMPSGGFPDVMLENGTVVTNFGKPPVLSWACAIVDRHSPDDKFLNWAYERFVQNEKHWRTDRGGNATGLFHYGTDNPQPDRRSDDAKLESGWDNSVRWDQGCNTLWAIDLNCFMLMSYDALAYMAERLGHYSDIDQWKNRRAVLAQRINETLWHDRAGSYKDFDFARQQFSSVLSPACFMPLYTRIASEQQAVSMAKLAADRNKFYPGFPSVTYDDAQYHSDQYWRGPTWLNIAYFALKGLCYYGQDNVADACRSTILKSCANNEDALYEYYDSKSGKGLGARDFGWSAAFVVEFVTNWNRLPDL